MPKRRTYDSDDYYVSSPDDPIGLTSAFETVRDPQAVEYDKGDQAIGLTEAFAVVGTPEPRAWDEEGKWKDFDWNAEWGADEPSDLSTDDPASQAQPMPEAHQASVRTVGSVGEKPQGQGVSSAPFNDEAREFDVTKDLAHASIASAAGKASSRGKHAAQAPEVSERMRQSHRMRKRLIVVIVLLVLGLCALGYFVFKTVSAGQEEAEHQAQEQIEAPKDTSTDTEGDDTVETAVEQADVPNLVSLFGKTSDAAVSELGRGATVSNTQKVKDKKSAIKTNVTVALTDEPTDSKTGSPNVYLGLDKGGKIIQVGYSASAGALGFGSLSFADAISSEHVIERTFEKMGVTLPEGTVVLPADPAKYSTYADDKTTIIKERCSFDGDVDVEGTACEWSAVLSYDYTTQVITGNLSDTVRIIYVYVTKK